MAGSASLGLWPLRSLARGRRRPNFLLILADDLGIECLRAYGGSSYETPNLDRLAARGTVFTHCFSTPLCSPSRLELLTGRYPFRNYEGWGRLDPESEITFGELLRREGYRTAVAGKWQLARFDRPGEADHPLRCGFGRSRLWTWVMTHEGRPVVPSKYWDPAIWEDGGLRLGLPAGSYGPDLFTDFLIEFITEPSTAPFLAFYPMVLPHAPFRSTPHSGPLTAAIPRLPNVLRTRLLELVFADMVAYMDHCVGRLLDALERAGLEDDTLVLFTADNGTHAGIESTMDGRTILGGKGSLSEPGTRVPLIAAWPGHVPAGRRCDDLVDLSDFLPTLAELAATPLPDDRPIDGRSFAARLLGGDGPAREWVYISHWEYPDAAYHWAVRTAQYKVHDDGQLFDLHEDPWEQRPLPETPSTREVRGRLTAIAREIGGIPDSERKAELSGVS